MFARISSEAGKFQRLFQIVAPILVLLIGYFTYFRGYAEPKALFWDENYHIASAQKYLNGIFFMEPHPPLGKLLIAAGESIFRTNTENNAVFIGTDHAQELPKNFSFTGYRFFPSLLAWWCGVVLYLLFYQITGRIWPALMLSCLYLFDNALIVHARSAMLDGSLLFFVSVALYFFHSLYREKTSCSRLRLLSLAFGLASGLALATKATALVLVAFGAVLIWRMYREGRGALVIFLVWSLIPALIAYAAIWEIHFVSGENINKALSHKGFYEASPEVRERLERGEAGSLASFFPFLKDNLSYATNYQRGVPRLNLCKVGELGSPWFLWPYGSRAINYRWETVGNLTRYLYLQINPAGWAIGLVGLVLGFALVVGQSLTGSTMVSAWARVLRGEMAAYLCAYILYMTLIAQLGRVMYLYHYFIPLLFAWALFGYVVVIVTDIGPLAISRCTKDALLALFAALVVWCFFIFSPLTYYKPISDVALAKLGWLKLWDLRCARCSVENGFAAPVYNPNVKPFPDVAISGLKAESGYQEWGDPKQDRSVDGHEVIVAGKRYGQAIGVHAKSSLKFAIKRSVARFEGKVAVPDYLQGKPEGGGSVIFEVRGDGRVLWTSGLIRIGMPPVSFHLDLHEVGSLELVVLDGGDGNQNDHAVWIDLKFS